MSAAVSPALVFDAPPVVYWNSNPYALASGEVLEWRDDAIVARHELPRPGTARCIAVHPQTPRGPLLAVGLKVEGKERRGYVACLAIE